MFPSRMLLRSVTRQQHQCYGCVFPSISRLKDFVPVHVCIECMLRPYVIIHVCARLLVLTAWFNFRSGFHFVRDLVGPNRRSAMPSRRRVRPRVLWQHGQVLNYDGYELAGDIPQDRSHWIWVYEDQSYYLMFDVGPEQLELLQFDRNLPAVWVGTSVHADQGQERLRIHMIAGVYMDHAGRLFPLWWCCEVLGAYVDPNQVRKVI